MSILSCSNIQHLGVVKIKNSTSGTPEYSSDIEWVVLKRKEGTTTSAGTSFMNIYAKKVSKEKDLYFELDDYFCRNNTTYTYKVQYIKKNGIILNTSNVVEVRSDFCCLVIADRYKTYTCPLNCSSISFTNVKPFVVNTPMYSRKPSYYNFTNINYAEGNCKGTFVDIDDTGRNIEFVYKDNWRYRRDFKEWLMEGNAKIIKSVSGEMWLVGIKTDSISDSGLFSDAEVEAARLIEFSWIEIGEVDDELDLYENDLIDIDSDYEDEHMEN